MFRMSIIDALVFGCGIYILYHSYIMRRDAVIPVGVMINKDMTVPKNADVAGFILDMFWKGIFVGLCACFSGIIGILSVRITQLQIVATIFSFVFFGILVLFIVLLKKAQKKYLHIS